jgi:hypothetical protein
MGFFGNLLGQGLGALGSRFLPIPGVDGKQLGGALGGMLPFQKGGRVPAHKIMGYERGGAIPSNRYQRGGKVKKSKSKK